MKIDPQGKARLELILLGLHPAEPLIKATIHESGETATVQVANKYYRYRLSETAKKVLQGQQTYWTEQEAAEFFTLLEETK